MARKRGVEKRPTERKQSGKRSIERRTMENKPMERRTMKKKKKSKLRVLGRLLLIIAIVIVIALGVIVGVGAWYIGDKLGKVNYVDINEENLEIDEKVEEQLIGYRTIAIFGVDSRSSELETGTRSDCIILATINEKTKEVTLTSVYRDTYLEIPGKGLDKITHAYSYGGAELALSTLNTNLDLNVKEFVTVNFNAVVDIVNAVGGVSIQITNSELQYINEYIDEINRVTKHKSKHITKAGKQNLDGVQALAYGRIRYTAGGDYKRTERMRDIMMAVVEKVKKMSISQLNSLADKVLPIIYTNISSSEIISLIPQAASFKITDSTGWPYKTEGKTINGVWYGPPITLESNVTELHQKVYGQADYVPSDKVKEISTKIVKKTGLK